MLFPYFDQEFSSFFLLYLSLSYFSLYVYDLELLVRNFLIILRVYLILQVLQVVSVLGLRGFFLRIFCGVSLLKVEAYFLQKLVSFYLKFIYFQWKLELVHRFIN